MDRLPHDVMVVGIPSQVLQRVCRETIGALFMVQLDHKAATSLYTACAYFYVISYLLLFPSHIRLFFVFPSN